MFRHMMEKRYSIDGKNASFVFDNKNKEVLQMVESVLISKLPPNFNTIGSLKSGDILILGDFLVSPYYLSDHSKQGTI